MMDLEIEHIKFWIINIYRPIIDSVDFYLQVKSKISDREQGHLLIFGDFNLILNPNLDCYNYTNLNNPKARQTVLDIIKECAEGYL